MPSISNRLKNIAKSIGVGTSPENIQVVFAEREDGEIFILTIHNTALQGIVKPSIHDTDISDLDFITLASKQQRVSAENIATALSNEDNFFLEN